MSRYFLFLLVVLSFVGCKSVQYQKSEVLNRQDEISSLKERIDQAIANDVDVLAPKHFGQAKALFDRAVAQAQNSKLSLAGNKTAESGLEAIAKAEKIADEARNTLREALQKREDAQRAGAHELFQAEFDRAEKDLQGAGMALEDGNKREGLEINASLAGQFGELEIKALKKNISEKAERAYNDAVQADAKHLAPITLNNAKNELDVAKRIIDIEKQNYDKALYHADRALYIAKQARHIAELLVGFKKEKLTGEQIVLWYQTQLLQIHNPLPTELRYDVDNNEVVSAFNKEIARTVGDLNKLQGRAVVAEKKMAQLSEKLSVVPGDKGDKALLEQATLEENFREISSLFAKNEAEVVKRGNDVVIRSHGFYFPVGKADLLPENFGLLHKIETAIAKFPKALIQVEGHTDATGSKNINMRLSQERAKNIAIFLVEVAGIPASRVVSFGVGSEKPIANNQTQTGREKNRRIEIIIKGRT